MHAALFGVQLAAANYATPASARDVGHQAEIFFQKGAFATVKVHMRIDRAHWYHAELRRFFNVSIEEVAEMTAPTDRVIDAVAEVSDFMKPRVGELCGDVMTDMRHCRLDPLVELAAYFRQAARALGQN